MAGQHLLVTAAALLAVVLSLAPPRALAAPGDLIGKDQDGASAKVDLGGARRLDHDEGGADAKEFFVIDAHDTDVRVRHHDHDHDEAHAEEEEHVEEPPPLAKDPEDQPDDQLEGGARSRELAGAEVSEAERPQRVARLLDVVGACADAVAANPSIPIIEQYNGGCATPRNYNYDVIVHCSGNCAGVGSVWGCGLSAVNDLYTRE